MGLTRRSLLQGLSGATALMTTGTTLADAAQRGDRKTPDAPATPSPTPGAITLPDRSNFLFDGIHLNAAYTHPVGLRTTHATMQYLQSRMREPGRNWPAQNARDDAVRMYAALINATPTEIAIVPSTLEGENLIAASLGLGPGAGVVTDPFHYDASLAMYGELHKQGMPLSVVTPRDSRIDYADLEKAITPETRLVAISLVSSDTGFMHDLKTVCEIAHRKGALVYADIIQAVGGIPFDVRQSGVDFCCAGMYKWLMGEFGSAFLYIRADRLSQMKRVQLGWRGIKSFKKHFMPFDPPGPVTGEWTLGTDTASIFEVSTADWSALASITGSLAYIDEIGVDRIATHRAPMLNRIQEEIPRAGFIPMTPRDHQGPSVVFAYKGARARFHDPLAQAKIYTTLYPDKIRISPSVHNGMDDIDALLRVLMA